MVGFVKGVNTNGEPLRDFYVEHDAAAFAEPEMLDGCTRQEFAEECDINVLLARYEKTGVLNHFNRGEAAYLDLSEGVPDLMTAMAVLDKAQTAFMSLDARTRAEFDNDPVKFVQFAEDPANLERMREFGLAPPAPAEPPPVRVQMVGGEPPVEPAPAK